MPIVRFAVKSLALITEGLLPLDDDRAASQGVGHPVIYENFISPRQLLDPYSSCAST